MSELKFSRVGLFSPEKPAIVSNPFVVVNFGSDGVSAIMKFYSSALTSLGLSTEAEDRKVTIDFAKDTNIPLIFNPSVIDFEIKSKPLSKSNTVRLLKEEVDKLFSAVGLPKETTQFNLKEVVVEGIKVFQLEKVELVVKERTAKQLEKDAENKALSADFVAWADKNKAGKTRVDYNKWLIDNKLVIPAKFKKWAEEKNLATTGVNYLAFIAEKPKK